MLARGRPLRLNHLSYSVHTARIADRERPLTGDDIRVFNDRFWPGVAGGGPIPNHRLPPGLTEDAAPRSLELLGYASYSASRRRDVYRDDNDCTHERRQIEKAMPRPRKPASINHTTNADN